jgi:hypothetical protein
LPAEWLALFVGLEPLAALSRPCSPRGRRPARQRGSPTPSACMSPCRTVKAMASLRTA